VKKVIVPILFLVGLVGSYWAVREYGLRWMSDRPYASDSALPEKSAPTLETGRKVAFLELGSVGCRPCEAMKPILKTVQERYPNQVDVIFYDVKKDPSKATEYRIRLIPTQVFLLPDGDEFFRHEGYFAESDVLAVLRKMGVR
jgi:thioredoxin 1